MEQRMPRISEEEVKPEDLVVAITADNTISSTYIDGKYKVRRCVDRSIKNCSGCNIAEACTIYLAEERR